MSALQRLRLLLQEERGIDDVAEGDYLALERALRGEQPLGPTLAYLSSRPCLIGQLAHEAAEEVV